MYYFLRRDPREILHFLHRHGLMKRFPNLTADIRIVLIRPVSVVTGERSFSQLKLIKSHNHVAREISGSSHVSVESETSFHERHCQSVAKNDQEGKIKS